jgi:putative component of membrane protein insertase Oxa1/YidC/SpoIIIJ protein YidD
MMPLRALSDVLRRILIGSIKFAASRTVPRWAQFLAIKISLGSIWAYKFTLSPWLGRQCLFRPSCSTRALAFMQNLGWEKGIHEVLQQVHRCSGNFLVRRTQEGRLELERADGCVFSEDELSTFILVQYGPMRSRSLLIATERIHKD